MINSFCAVKHLKPIWNELVFLKMWLQVWWNSGLDKKRVIDVKLPVTQSKQLWLLLLIVVLQITCASWSSWKGPIIATHCSWAVQSVSRITSCSVGCTIWYIIITRTNRTVWYWWFAAMFWNSRCYDNQRAVLDRF